MDLAWLSLIALLVVIVVSCVSTINAGIVAIALAWVVGLYAPALFGVEPLQAEKVIEGFPRDLFLRLVGVTLLFAQAQRNGTLELVSRVAVRGCRGNAGLVPVMFFGLSFALAAVGAGNIAATAMLAPMAMAVAERVRIPAFLMTIMVVHGSLAGALSPVAPTGMIANERMAEMGMGGHEGRTFLYNFLANIGVGLGGYLLLGGWRLLRRDVGQPHPEPPAPALEKRTDGVDDAEARDLLQAGGEAGTSFGPQHALTAAVIGLLVVGVVFFRVETGLASFAGVVVLALAGRARDYEAVGKVPWGVILMVCGVSVLTAVMDKVGGTARLAQVIAAVSTERTAPGVLALVTGLVSVYSSTSGVVLPAFLPMVPDLVEQVGGSRVALASSVIVGGHLVDSSPLSTLGALCIACAPAGEDRRVLFNKVLAWGLSMAVVGAAICYVCFGLL